MTDLCSLAKPLDFSLSELDKDIQSTSTASSAFSLVTRKHRINDGNSNHDNGIHSGNGMLELMIFFTVNSCTVLSQGYLRIR